MRASAKCWMRSTVLAQTIMAARGEVEIAVITEHLKLLTNFLLHMPVLRIKLAQLSLKSIDVIQIKFGLTYGVDAFHNLDKPTSYLSGFVAKEKCSLPLG